MLGVKYILTNPERPKGRSPNLNLCLIVQCQLIYHLSRVEHLLPIITVMRTRYGRVEELESNRRKSLNITVMKIFRDHNFLKFIHIIENLVSKVLSIALIVVIIISVIDLIIVLSKDMFTVEPVGFFEKTLIDIFGLFLNVLIALELLENITAYLRKHIVQVELVVVTALIAVARKIIIFDPKQFQKTDLIALAFASLALSASYWLLRRTTSK